MLQIQNLANLGFMGIVVDQKYGGSGADSLSLSVAVEEISRWFKVNHFINNIKQLNIMVEMHFTTLSNIYNNFFNLFNFYHDYTIKTFCQKIIVKKL